MTRRLLLSYLTVTLVVLLLLEIPLAVFYAQRERERLMADVERDASVIATIYEDALEAGVAPDPRPAVEYEARTGARVVVVDLAGISVVDTDNSAPRDFSTRPEIAVALTGTRATGTRPSETLDTDLLYVALPVASGGVVHGALRLTLDTGDVDRHIHRFWGGLAAIAAIVLAAMALIGWAIARSVTRPVRRLTDAALRFANGDLSAGPVEADDGPPELRALGATMSTMAERLAVLLEEQRAFVADASHQLRTPLTALRLRLENLQSHLSSADAAELEAAIDETTRLASLVSDLLQLARADRRRTAVEIDLAEAARERVETWSALADGQEVRLRVVGADQPAPARAVAGAVEQILDNALDNALHVAPPGTEVTVAVERGATSHRITISDRGPGLSEEDKGRAFHRFWQGTTSAPGSGLGLAIADVLARESGGAIRLEDHLGGGLTVVVTLPAVDSLVR